MKCPKCENNKIHVHDIWAIKDFEMCIDCLNKKYGIKGCVYCNIEENMNDAEKATDVVRQQGYAKLCSYVYAEP
jgi:predicted nucleic-acid-binding Zn-ribbon protein